MSENTFLPFRTVCSGERNLVNSWCYDEPDFSLSLEMTFLGESPSLLAGFDFQRVEVLPPRAENSLSRLNGRHRSRSCPFGTSETMKRGSRGLVFNLKPETRNFSKQSAPTSSTEESQRRLCVLRTAADDEWDL
jgi:hypothetical protein